MMHAATTFKLMRETGNDILENLKSEDWLYVRKVIIEMILATDMAKHFDIVGNFRTTFL